MRIVLILKYGSYTCEISLYKNAFYLPECIKLICLLSFTLCMFYNFFSKNAHFLLVLSCIVLWPHVCSSHPSPSCLPCLQDQLFLHFSSERSGLPRISTKHEITSYNKTSQKRSYQDWMRQGSRRIRISKASKRGRDSFIPFVRGPTRTPSYQL